MPFAKGQSGNPSGTKTMKRFMEALTRANAQDDGKRLRQAADSLLDQAASGESWAIQMLADRFDGKAVQAIRGPGEDGAFLFSEVVRRIESK